MVQIEAVMGRAECIPSTGVYWSFHANIRKEVECRAHIETDCARCSGRSEDLEDHGGTELTGRSREREEWIMRKLYGLLSSAS